MKVGKMKDRSDSIAQLRRLLQWIILVMLVGIPAILIVLVGIPVFCSIIIFSEPELSPEPLHFERLRKAGINLSEDITVLYFYADNQRDVDYNGWVIFSPQSFSNAAPWTSSLGPYFLAPTQESCKLIISMINKRIYKRFKKEYSLSSKNFVSEEMYFLDADPEQIRASNVQAKNGYYLYLTLIKNQ